nr:hypothetical protein [Micromonospora sp. DSM 115978]
MIIATGVAVGLIHMAIRGISATIQEDPEAAKQAAKVVGKGAWKAAKWVTGSAAAGLIGDEAARIIRGS